MRDDFKSDQGLRAHDYKKHPYIAPPEPKKTTIRSINIQYASRYDNGKKIEIGDVFYRIEKHVAKSITVTEGSETVYIESEITKQNYQMYKP